MILRATPTTMFVASLVASFVASRADASEPSVRGRTRTTVMVGGEPRAIANGAGGMSLVEREFVPIVEDVFLDADTGVDGLTVAVDGWFAADAGEGRVRHRALADLTQGFVRWHTSSFTVTAGRVLPFSLTARALRLDGAELRVHPDVEFLGARYSLAAWTGVPVTARFGDEPLVNDIVLPVGDSRELARDGADWRRPGDFAVGASLEARFGDRTDVALGFRRVSDLAEVSEEAVVGRLAFAPVEHAEISGFLSYDLFAASVEEARVDLAWWLQESLRLALVGRIVDPALLLSSTSIFSVFGGAVHRNVGADMTWYADRDQRLSGSFEWRMTDALYTANESESGYEASLDLRSSLPSLPGTYVLAGWNRVEDPIAGRCDRLKLGGEIPLRANLSLSLDGGLFVFGEGRRTVFPTESRGALRVGASGVFTFGDAWRAVLSLRGTDYAGIYRELAAIGRLEWNVERAF